MANQSSDNPLRVLFLAAEAEPFIKVGGLGDVGGALPSALHHLSLAESGVKLDIRLVLPLHPMIQTEKHEITWVRSFDVPTSQGLISAQLHRTHLDGMVVYFIASPHFNDEAAVYSMDTSRDAEKYIFFSVAALEIARILDWIPDIIHANDWHTAAAIYALAQQAQLNTWYSQTKGVLTLHNLPFMGAGTEKAMQKYGLPAIDDARLPVWSRQFPLVTGLVHADAIVAVSPTYAKEILTPEFGCGLQDFLMTRTTVIQGILNGQDIDVWNPAHDPHIGHNYDVNTIAQRQQNKLELMSEFDLPSAKDTPLLILVSRMDPQKGVDIAVDALRMLKKFRWQAILLGSGDQKLEQSVQDLADELPKKVRAAIKFDSKLSHRMYAGADMLLMPSRYEPCGLSQMNAMLYGCIPVVRATGGLKDTVIDKPPEEGGTGFSCEKAEAEDFASALSRAMNAYSDKAAWLKRQINAMKQDFSWNGSAFTYARLYQTLRRNQ